jgi:hypothetical protein
MAMMKTLRSLSEEGPAKKNPRIDYLDPGISLFYPQDLQAAPVREGCYEKSRQVF